MTHVDGMSVVGTLRGASVLIDGGLHLFQDMVDLLQVVLGAEVGHGREVVVLGKGAVRAGAADGKSRRGSGSGDVFARHTARLQGD